MKDLQESRKEIDSIDSEIVSLFERRMEVCKGVAEYKLRTGKAVLDRQRELDKIKTLKNKASSVRITMAANNRTQINQIRRKV